MSATATGVLDNVRLIRWLLGHSESIPVLMGYFDSYRAASGLRAKWYEGIRPSGDLIVDIIDTLPTVQAMAVEPGDVQAMAVGLGIDWGALEQLAQFLLPIVVDMLLKLR